MDSATDIQSGKHYHSLEAHYSSFQFFWNVFRERFNNPKQILMRYLVEYKDSWLSIVEAMLIDFFGVTTGTILSSSFQKFLELL